MAYFWSIPSEAGPSTLTPTSPPSSPSTVDDATGDSTRGAVRRERKRRLPRLESSTAVVCAFLSPALAVTPSRRYPPPNRPTINPASSIRERVARRDSTTSQREKEEDMTDDTGLVYPTSVVVPSDIPTKIVTVDQTVLPYYLTQNADGTWDKEDNAWRLYGREAGVERDGVLIGSSDNNFSVESSLPKGWGQSSSRTNLYRVPLIVACSMILAIGIVIGIICLVFNRRKAHRKAKRKAERQRRKALQAAGIDPSSMDARAQEAAFKEKLEQLEKQHRSKQRKDGNVGFARVKVKKWTGGLRRRNARSKEGEERALSPTIEVVEAVVPKPENDEREATPSLNTISSVVGGDTTDTTDGMGPRTFTDDSTRNTDTTSPSVSVDSTPHPRNGSDAGNLRDPPAPYLPPEYRPASVRSYSMADRPAGSSRRRSSTGDDATESGAAAAGTTDKTRAPGYYPAPATEDAEQAMEVVSRAEGKRPIPPPAEDEDRERVRHIATDDKRLLEQMRLGASAPPVAGGSGAHVHDETDGEAGPSAPGVEVDQDGFEAHGQLEDVLPPPRSGFGGGSTMTTATTRHPDIPAPPRLPAQRSLGPLASPSEPLDELHLLPSAPPVASGADMPSAPPMPSSPSTSPLAPSAPPMDLDVDDEQYGQPAPISLAPPVEGDGQSSTPSAPPLDVTEDGPRNDETDEQVNGDVPVPAQEAEAADGELVSEQPHVETERQQPRLFLPKYEP